MASKLDLRVPPGVICAQALFAIQNSTLYRALSAVWSDVEVWPVSNQPRNEFAHFWLVSQDDGVVRELSCVRYSCRPGAS